MSTETTAAVVVPERRGIAALLSTDSATMRIAPFLPEGVSVDRVIAAAQLAADNNSALLKCTPKSIVMAVARVMSWGLEIGNTAHLVPFGDTCTPVADYKGLAELAVASGAVRHVEAREVRDGDTFVFRYGLNPILDHQPVGGSDRPITHAYCVIQLPMNRYAFEVMTAEEINAIRMKNSKQWKSGPLTGWYARKTVTRRILKTVPKNPRLAATLRVLHEDAEEESPMIAAITERDDTPTDVVGDYTPGDIEA